MLGFFLFLLCLSECFTSFSFSFLRESCLKTDPCFTVYVHFEQNLSSSFSLFSLSSQLFVISRLIKRNKQRAAGLESEWNRPGDGYKRKVMQEIKTDVLKNERKLAVFSYFQEGYNSAPLSLQSFHFSCSSAAAFTYSISLSRISPVLTSHSRFSSLGRCGGKLILSSPLRLHPF